MLLKPLWTWLRWRGNHSFWIVILFQPPDHFVDFHLLLLSKSNRNPSPKTPLLFYSLRILIFWHVSRICVLTVGVAPYISGKNEDASLQSSTVLVEKSLGVIPMLTSGVVRSSSNFLGFGVNELASQPIILTFDLLSCCFLHSYCLWWTFSATIRKPL